MSFITNCLQEWIFLITVKRTEKNTRKIWHKHQWCKHCYITSITIKAHLRNLLGLEWELFTPFILSDSFHLTLVALQFSKDILCLKGSRLLFFPSFFLKHAFLQLEKLFKAISFHARNTPIILTSAVLNSSPISITICLVNT